MLKRIVLALSALLWTSCTRPLDDSSVMRLSLASTSESLSVGALSSQLSMIIINVSGPGIPSPILFQWNRHSCPSGNCPVPSEISLAILGVSYHGVDGLLTASR